MEITMLDILRALQAEIGTSAFSLYEWYCKTYNVTLTDIAPATVRFEVLGY